MKERIKRFYRDHESGCNKLLAAGAFVGTVQFIRTWNGHKLDDANLWEGDNGASIILVSRRNGNTATFYKEPKNQV